MYHPPSLRFFQEPKSIIFKIVSKYSEENIISLNDEFILTENDK